MKNNISKWISILYRRRRVYLVSRLREYQIGSSEITMLMILFRCDGVSQETLSTELATDKAATTRVISALEDKGYIKRMQNPLDKREKQVFLTEYALSKKAGIRAIMRDSNNILLQGIEQKDIDVTYQVLLKMIANLDQQMKL